MKRIICFHLYNDFSGSPIVLRMVLEGLLRKGFKVDLVTSNGGVLDELVGMDGFIPKLVVISDGYDVALIPIVNVSGGTTKGIYFSVLSESVTFADNSYAMIPIYARLLTAFYPSVTLYLHTNVTNKNQAACQMNASGTEYTVIVIGSEYTQES